MIDSNKERRCQFIDIDPFRSFIDSIIWMKVTQFVIFVPSCQRFINFKLIVFCNSEVLHVSSKFIINQPAKSDMITKFRNDETIMLTFILHLTYRYWSIFLNLPHNTISLYFLIKLSIKNTSINILCMILWKRMSWRSQKSFSQKIFKIQLI